MKGQIALLDDVFDHGGEHDFWETTPDAVAAILPLLPKAYQENGSETRWHLIEPCAGRGAILDAAFHELAPCALTAIEIERSRHAVLERNWGAGIGHIVRGDFLKLEADELRVGLGPNLWITNPPYSKPYEGIGLDIVQHALELSGPRDCVAFLLQHDFATGVGPVERIHDRWPSSLYPLKRRPTFSGDGQTGKRPFSWFVFDRLNPKREWRPIG